MQVLIVDDDANCRQILELMLEKKGWTLHTARNGKEGLAMARALKPDLILMDILMPEMSGLEAVRAMRADPELAGVKIFAVTALAFEQERLMAIAAGYDLVITKPFGRRQLLDAIQRVFPDAFETPADKKVPA